MKIQFSFVTFLALCAAAPVAFGDSPDPGSSLFSSSDKDEVASSLRVGLDVSSASNASLGSDDPTDSLATRVDSSLHANNANGRNLAPKISKYDSHVKILHMGDSYSSGNGANGLSYLSVGPKWCFRHDTNWGRQATDILRSSFEHPDALLYINRACAGSKIKHLYEDYLLLEDDGEHVNKGECKEYLPEMRLEKTEFPWPFADHCRNIMRPQLDEVSNDVDLVLITTGGNDAKFGDIVRDCILVYTGRNKEKCETSIAAVKNFINDDYINMMYNAMEQLFDKLKPEARVVIGAYPYLTVTPEQEGTTSGFEDTRWANTLIRDVVALANEKQKEVVDKLNRKLQTDAFHFFAESTEIFDTHEAMTTTLQQNPDGFLVEMDASALLCSGLSLECQKQLYHPNERGHTSLGIGMSNFLKNQVLPKLLTERRKRRDRSSAKYPDSSFDFALLIDTTLSEEALKGTKDAIKAVSSTLSAITESWRFGILSYGCEDGDTKFLQEFTNDPNELKKAIGSVKSKTCETGSLLLSGLDKVFSHLPWRDGVTSNVIVLAGTEPDDNSISDLEASVNLIEDLGVVIDVVAFWGVDPGHIIFKTVVEESGGVALVNENVDVVAELGIWVEEKATIPVAFMTELGYEITGQPVSVNAQGSFDPKYQGIVSYVWNFLDGDARGQVVTIEPFAEFVYEEDYDGHVNLEVKTADGRVSNKISVPITVNEFGLPEGYCDEDPTAHERCGATETLPTAAPTKVTKKGKNTKQNKPTKKPKGSKK